MNPSTSNASRTRGPGIAARHASRATPSRPGRRRPAPGRLMVMRRLTKPRPRRRPRPVGPLRVQHAYRILVGWGWRRPCCHTGPVSLCKASTSSGSSHATEAVCGHHAPSMSPPRRVARAIRAGRAERRGPLMPFTMMALWRRENPPRARPRKWGAPLPMLRHRLKRQTQAPGGEKTS